MLWIAYAKVTVKMNSSFISPYEVLSPCNSFNNVVGTSYDAGCFFSHYCSQISGHLRLISWLLVLAPPVFYLIIWFVGVLERRALKFGVSLFRVKYLDQSKFFCYGWQNFGSFRDFMFEELVLFMALCAGVIIYFVNDWTWLSRFLS